MVLSALFGVFRGKATIDVLKTMNGIMGDLKDFFFKTLYLWTIAFDSNISCFHVFLKLVSSSS